MNFWKAVSGMVCVTLTGADPCESLRLINDKGIHVFRVVQVDSLTVIFWCAGSDCHIISKITSKRGDSLKFEEKTGILYILNSFFQRPILAAALLVLFGLTLYLPTKVFFFEVKGNERIPSYKILEATETCGIHFGVSRRKVRSEQMKNALLGTMPELQWAGINTAGCTAVISVREREIQEEKNVPKGISSIVAARDGFITSCTVTRGNALCVPGQVVQEGEVLVSGYTDCGICLQVTGAVGEIFANTSHDFCVVTPSERSLRVEQTNLWRRYSLILGKKRINLWKGSGISPVSCGRIYKEYYITLPGGFRLPICLGVETLTQWKTTAEEISENEILEQMKSHARASVLSQTVAGSILREDMALEQTGGLLRLEGNFLCSEMIGRVITEEIGDANGKIN